MEFFKKQKFGFYGLAVAAVLVLVAMIVFEVAFAGSEGFFAQQAPNAPVEVAVYSVIAIVLIALAIVVNQLKIEGAAGKVVEIVADLALIAAGLLIGIAAYLTIDAYVYDYVIINYSDLHNGDTAVINAVGVAVASTVVYIVGFLAAVVSSCFSIAKK